MSANRFTFQRLRIILDCTLVVLLILLVSAGYLTAQARSRVSAPAADSLSSGPPLTSDDLAGAQPAAASSALDDDTLAAVIAAENAALTPPSYFTELPLVTR